MRVIVALAVLAAFLPPSIVWADGPACRKVDATVVCDAESFEFLMDDYDTRRALLEKCEARSADCASDLNTCRDVIAASPAPTDASPRAVWAFGLGVVGTAATALGVGLAVGGVGVEVWGPVTGGGVGLAALGGVVAVGWEW